MRFVDLVSFAATLLPAAPALLLATAPVAVPVDAGGDGGDDDGAAPTATPSIAEVGRELLAGMTEAERNQPLGTEDDDEGDDGAGDDDDAAGDALAAEAAAKRTAAPPAPAAAPAPAAGRPKGGKAAAEVEPVLVALPGIADRGEEDLEIAVDDPEIATRLQRLKNDGLRAAEYRERIAVVEAREGRFNEYEQALADDPVGFHLSRMPVDEQIQVARALVLEHLDVLQPEIEKLMDDPAARHKQRADLKDTMATTREKVTRQRETRAYVAQVVAAVEDLVPEGTDDELAREFVADARSVLGAAAKRNERVAPETVKKLLARKLALYGFDKPAARRPAPGAPPAARTTSARPVSDRARAIAAERTPGSDAAAAQSRVRRTQVARSAASRVAPVGAGAAPTQSPAAPAEAEQSIAAMSKHLRKEGLPDSWAARET